MTRALLVAAFVAFALPGTVLADNPKPDEAAKKDEPKKDEPKKDQKTESCAFDLDVKTAGQWVTILPERQPPTRSRLSFDSSSGNIDVEWDPYDGRGLLRRVVLPVGKWHVSFWSEPQRDSMRFDRNYAWQPAPQSDCPSGEFKKGSKGTFMLTELGLATQSSTVKIEVTGEEKRTFGGQAESRLMEDSGTTGQLMRSFDVADLPAKLAEVAIKVVVQRVERKALRVATAKLREILCQKNGDRLVFPATCAIVEALDLRSLPSIANHFAAALASDLFTLAQTELVVDDATKDVIAKVFSTAVQVSQLLQQVKEMGADELQARFLAMAEATFEVKAPPAGVCAAQLALALVAYCESSSQCNASFLHDVIQNPSTYFATGSCDAAFARADATKQRIEAIIADGRTVFRAAQSLTSLDRAAAALRANLRVIELMVCSDETAAACVAGKQLTGIGVALAAGDLSAIGSAAETMIAKHATKWATRHRKMVSLFLTFMSDGLPIASKNPEEAKLAQARLEKAFDLFLDGAADRDGRDGDVIASLAASLRVTGGVDFGGEFRGPLSLPFGVGIDFTFKNGDEQEEGKTKGFHLELDAVDLGNYIQFDNDAQIATPKWADLACLSAGLGFFWGDNDAPFSLTLTGGAAPGTTTNDAKMQERAWTGFIALNFGVYVPLIDLN